MLWGESINIDVRALKKYRSSDTRHQEALAKRILTGRFGDDQNWQPCHVMEQGEMSRRVMFVSKDRNGADALYTSCILNSLLYK